MKFKVGDKVRFIGDATTHSYPGEDLKADIKKYNNIFTISYISNEYLEFKENRIWCIKKYEIELIQEKQFTKADLKDGDKCTLRNGQVVFVDKTSTYSFSSIDEQLSYFNDDVSIIKVERPIEYKTVFERKEEILDKTEKRYLSGVIRPFKNKVISILKGRVSTYDKEFILIELEKEIINLPFFKSKTMYKGMKENKKYTLKELGL